ncbi:MerR family transcriptional regulator [Actinoplanes bogorensis]|uniref:MerR family transcriptional regulator n=1 Tax=Paractinoplanes bogorensis TaxID=1610840 RepID=A0ABS5YKP8_9ACTN|nr:MerR family transcriptional regulator [Actinoplanes bogorensis]MBU2663997.1 MerR family transcriptional regulator [Actinoplanes bogorensis]
MWSTREVADLAGTSLRTVRHYHEVGLLDEPDRRTNGYKQYTVAHLVRLLRIKRLTALGFSLSQIAAMDDDDHQPVEAMQALDAELAETIERLQRAREELALLMRKAVPDGVPVEFAEAANPDMSEADRSFITILTGILGPRSLQPYVDLMRDTPPFPVGTAFDDLPPDADDATRQDLAERIAPYAREMRARYPGLNAPATDAPRGPHHARTTVNQAIVQLYNAAQLDVLARMEVILKEPES